MQLITGIHYDKKENLIKGEIIDDTRQVYALTIFNNVFVWTHADNPHDIFRAPILEEREQIDKLKAQ